MASEKTKFSDQQMRPATQKGGILFVNHVAARNGAAMMLLHFLRWLKRNGDRPFSTLFVGGGELEAEFAAASDTWVASEGHWCPGGLRSQAARATGLTALSRAAERADLR